jgi:hypothetical protein
LHYGGGGKDFSKTPLGHISRIKNIVWLSCLSRAAAVATQRHEAAQPATADDREAEEKKDGPGVWLAGTALINFAPSTDPGNHASNSTASAATRSRACGKAVAGWEID